MGHYSLKTLLLVSIVDSSYLQTGRKTPKMGLWGMRLGKSTITRSLNHCYRKATSTGWRQLPRELTREFPMACLRELFTTATPAGKAYLRLPKEMAYTMAYLKTKLKMPGKRR